MLNPYRALLALLPDAPLLTGTVLSISGGVAQIEMPGGGIAAARGDATVGEHVFFRNDVIEGAAPSLSVEIIEV